MQHNHCQPKPVQKFQQIQLVSQHKINDQHIQPTPVFYQQPILVIPQTQLVPVVFQSQPLNLQQQTQSTFQQIQPIPVFLPPQQVNSQQLFRVIPQQSQPIRFQPQLVNSQQPVRTTQNLPNARRLHQTRRISQLQQNNTKRSAQFVPQLLTKNVQQIQHIKQLKEALPPGPITEKKPKKVTPQNISNKRNQYKLPIKQSNIKERINSTKQKSTFDMNYVIVID
ncbi:hypothetical protein QTN25_005470 [Entamoeba marina]